MAGFLSNMTSRVVIRLSEEEVMREYDSWIGLTQCESYAMTYLAKHPEEIGRNRRLGGGWKLAGVEVWLASSRSESKEGKRADLVFTRKGDNGKKDYLVVEAEDSCTKSELSDGWSQAECYASLLEGHLKKNRYDHNPVLAAVAAVDWKSARGRSTTGWSCGDEWQAE